jgi:phosphatidate cytidylyltransferase
MSNLALRIITAVLLLPIVIYALWAGGIYLLALLALVSLFCSIEIARIVSPGNTIILILAVLFWALLFCATTITTYVSHSIIFIALLLFINNLVFLFNNDIDAQFLERISTVFYFIFYIIIGMSCFFWLSLENIHLVFLACAVTWANDSCAYFGGRAFGKHPLFKSVSAKKTWEGFISGALGSALIIWLLALFIPHNLGTADFVWVIIPSMILAPCGDLIESRLKRIYHTKDASNILPGHGGLLDRIDALLLVIPWTAAYAFFIRPL